MVVDGNKVEEFDFESENKRQLAGNIYLAKVTRVEPSLQAAFIDYGGNRHGFLAFSEIHPDYYQIPIADREALMAEERAYAAEQEEEDEQRSKASSRSRSRSRGRSRAEKTGTEDAVTSTEAGISGMDVVDLDQDDDVPFEEGTSPAFFVQDTPVETPSAEDDTAETGDEVSDDDHEADDTAENDPADEIESIAEEDVSDEIPQARKPRPRKYKIQEVIKVRQILLVQVVKEERGNKGAALTTYLSLAGRYCVLMPNTARGGGISRKITNAQDRKKLKEIANEIEVPKGAGLIIRTAGSQRTKTEIKRDYEYLQRLWEQIRELTLKSIAPAKIYEEGDLIKRSIRDLYNKDIDEVFVEGEAGYRTAKDFMKMIMPSHAKNVKYYAEQMPLFARYQVESYLSSMFNPTVQLKSGGYIVIGVTEALVAIDVNSGRATKEGSIEETALKTNTEAAEEVARQLRLRDLAGLIVIDFIDMEERRNNAAVEKRFKDKLKTDRARIQVGRISGFGLMEMSRQRLRPGMIEATTAPCHHCHGTGLVRSDDNLALNILRQLDEEGTRRRSREVLLKAPIGIVNFLMNNKREHIAQIEARYGMSVRVEADPFLVSPDFAIEKFKTATRTVPEATAQVVSVNASLMQDIDEEVEVEIEDEVEAEVEPTPETAEIEDNGQQPKKKRRRRRRRKSGGNGGEHRDDDSGNRGSGGRDEARDITEQVAVTEAEQAQVESIAEAATDDAPAKKPARKRSSSSKSRTAKAKPEEATAQTEQASPGDVAAEEKPKRVSRTRKSPVAKAKPEAVEPEAVVPEPVDAPSAPEAVEPPAEKPKRASRAKPKPEQAADKAKEPAMAESTDDKPKKKGWWSLRG